MEVNHKFLKQKKKTFLSVNKGIWWPIVLAFALWFEHDQNNKKNRDSQRCITKPSFKDHLQKLNVRNHLSMRKTYFCHLRGLSQFLKIVLLEISDRFIGKNDCYLFSAVFKTDLYKYQLLLACFTLFSIFPICRYFCFAWLQIAWSLFPSVIISSSWSCWHLVALPPIIMSQDS